jgi:uncharacterized protein YndB with AHSA1/START domain
MTDRVELQTEVDARRADVFALLSTTDGLRIWLDDADIEPRVGGAVRLRLRDAEAQGTVLAFDPPQHIGFTFDWVDEPLGRSSVLAFDVIDHGARAHVTLRHVGLPTRAQVELHDHLWRHWLRRFEDAVRAQPAAVETPPAVDRRISGRTTPPRAEAPR